LLGLASCLAGLASLFWQIRKQQNDSTNKFWNPVSESGGSKSDPTVDLFGAHLFHLDWLIVVVLYGYSCCLSQCSIARCGSIRLVDVGNIAQVYEVDHV